LFGLFVERRHVIHSPGLVRWIECSSVLTIPPGNASSCCSSFRALPSRCICRRRHSRCRNKHPPDAASSILNQLDNTRRLSFKVQRRFPTPFLQSSPKLQTGRVAKLGQCHVCSRTGSFALASPRTDCAAGGTSGKKKPGRARPRPGRESHRFRVSFRTSSRIRHR
jgi:hypothetical protein